MSKGLLRVDFRGISKLSLDAKGRMSVPSRYRTKLAEAGNGQLVLSANTDNSLVLYPWPAFRELEARIRNLPSLNPQAKRLRRQVIGYANEVQLDSAGRILIQPELREYAGIDKKIVMLGQGDFFEVWDEAAWAGETQSWDEQGPISIDPYASTEALDNFRM